IEQEQQLMNTYDAKNAYQETTVAGANPIRLVMMVYDRLLTDMQKAIESLHVGDVELRTQSIRHAMECVDHLQSNLNMQDGGEAASFLWRFYTQLRAKLLEAQMKQSENTLKEQIWLVQQVRGEWDKAERQLLGSRELENTSVSVPVLVADEPGSSSAWTA
ncbi:MAG TPA: flagellar export chaperone FliS, partial [Terriglobales bacterium]